MILCFIVYQKELRFCFPQVNDATFASEVLGKGIAVIPSKGEVVAPCDAVVETVFDTKHAVGLSTESGMELLIHIGINTVELNGKYLHLM